MIIFRNCKSASKARGPVKARGPCHVPLRKTGPAQLSRFPNRDNSQERNSRER